jgi:signal transduction histidine kinase
LVLRAEAPVVGTWDAPQLELVVSNLIDNAAKFGAGKPVEVSVRRQGDDATLTVHDQGSGIPPDRVAHIFDAFARAVPPEHYGGLGLGLYISKAIVDAHGGRLTVESRPGEGSTFVASLPLNAPTDAQNVS